MDDQSCSSQYQQRSQRAPCYLEKSQFKKKSTWPKKINTNLSTSTAFAGQELLIGLLVFSVAVTCTYGSFYRSYGSLDRELISCLHILIYQEHELNNATTCSQEHEFSNKSMS
jgi:hypothetical protein